MKLLSRLGVVFIGVIVVIAIAMNAMDRAPAPPLPGYVGSASSPPPERWSYTSEQDPMSKGVERDARIASTRSLSFGFPYEGRQYPVMILRSHPRYGKNVVLMIEKGQFVCGVSSCTVSVRFDDAPAKAWPASGPSDHSTTTLFLRDHDAFLQKLATAKVVRIQATVFQEGEALMEFPVAGFSSAKYAGK